MPAALQALHLSSQPFHHLSLLHLMLIHHQEFVEHLELLLYHSLEQYLEGLIKKSKT